MFTIKRLFLNNSRCNQFVILRYKHKESHWSVQVKKKTATGKALTHFDDFYKTVYGKNWPSIRQGLLAEHKYVAVVNNYGESDETRTNLENTGALNIRTLFNLEKEYIIQQYAPYLKANNEHIKEEENVEIIPQQTHINNNKTPVINSVEEGLKQAKFDVSRIITPGSNDLFSALYEFIPATKIKGKEDWISETQHYRYYEVSDSFKVKIEKQYDLHFPEHLNVYCYEKSNKTVFESPKRGITNVFNYYLLDGASVLPVLALGIKPGDKVLDLCAAPGGKTLIALQTLYPENVVCSDVESSRVKRIYSVLRQYLYDLDEKWLNTGRIKVIQEDARVVQLSEFDCVLVDVPCTNDRLSLKENDNNWFKGSRTRERLQLPEVQAQILVNALKLVKVGGSVVYSTCSLSPIQNDGVVNMALKQIWEETNIQITIRDLSPALEPTKCVFKYAEQGVLKFGHLVVPYLPQNYGPMYFCKLIRTK